MKVYDIQLKFTALAEAPDDKIDSAVKVIEYLKGAFDEYPEQEQVYVLLLDRKNHIKGRHRITVGTQTACLAHPREVFRAAVVGGACAIIVAHNHPSGDPQPSSADVHITRALREAGKTLEVSVLDHVIVGEVGRDPCGKGHFSFREAGLV